MKTAILTGASSGIGLSIVKLLIEQQFKVYGLARNFDDCPFTNVSFSKIICDITNLQRLSAEIGHILKSDGRLDLLVNNAGVGFFGPHETISIKNIEQMVQTNLTAPLILTKLCLQKLRESKGTIINIASTAAFSPHRNGCAYAATKAGLVQFGQSIFEEIRRQEIKVTTICPDMTESTQFYNNTNFSPHSDTQSHILPSCVSDAVNQVLTQRNGTVIPQIIIKPQRIQINKNK